MSCKDFNKFAVSNGVSSNTLYGIRNTLME